MVIIHMRLRKIILTIPLWRQNRGEYRKTTVKTGSFRLNQWGLYDLHGNVNEWCFDYYGKYDVNDRDNPAGTPLGTRHVYRGGGWNDFAKNMRSAYRAAGPSDI